MLAFDFNQIKNKIISNFPSIKKKLTPQRFIKILLLFSYYQQDIINQGGAKEKHFKANKKQKGIKSIIENDFSPWNLQSLQDDGIDPRKALVSFCPWMDKFEYLNRKNFSFKAAVDQISFLIKSVIKSMKIQNFYKGYSL